MEKAKQFLNLFTHSDWSPILLLGYVLSNLNFFSSIFMLIVISSLKIFQHKIRTKSDFELISNLKKQGNTKFVSIERGKTTVEFFEEHPRKKKKAIKSKKLEQ